MSAPERISTRWTLCHTKQTLWLEHACHAGDWVTVRRDHTGMRACVTVYSASSGQVFRSWVTLDDRLGVNTVAFGTALAVHARDLYNALRVARCIREDTLRDDGRALEARYTWAVHVDVDEVDKTLTVCAGTRSMELKAVMRHHDECIHRIAHSALVLRGDYTVHSAALRASVMLRATARAAYSDYTQCGSAHVAQDAFPEQHFMYDGSIPVGIRHLTSVPPEHADGVLVPAHFLGAVTDHDVFYRAASHPAHSDAPCMTLSCVQPCTHNVVQLGFWCTSDASSVHPDGAATVVCGDDDTPNAASAGPAAPKTSCPLAAGVRDGAPALLVRETCDAAQRADTQDLHVECG